MDFMLKTRVIFNFISNSYSQFLLPRDKNATNKDSFSIEGGVNRSFDFYQTIYLRKKKQSKTHQVIFFALGAVFMALAAIIYFNTTNWACSLYFSHCEYIKPAAYSLCVLLSSITVLIGYMNAPEKDAANFLVYRIEKKLGLLYKRRRLELRGLFAIFFSDLRFKRQICKQHYIQALDKIREQRENAVHFLERIPYTTQDPKIKEKLIREALSDLNNALNGIVQSFKHKLI